MLSYLSHFSVVKERIRWSSPEQQALREAFQHIIKYRLPTTTEIRSARSQYSPLKDRSEATIRCAIHNLKNKIHKRYAKAFPKQNIEH